MTTALLLAYAAALLATLYVARVRIVLGRG
jgi:hypothetical protein